MIGLPSCSDQCPLNQLCFSMQFSRCSLLFLIRKVKKELRDPPLHFFRCFTLAPPAFARRTLVGSSGLEPPRRLRRHLGAAMNVSPFTPLNNPPDCFVPSAPALTSRLSRSEGSCLLCCGSLVLPSPPQKKGIWWAQVDSNHRPRAYQARALTS